MEEEPENEPRHAGLWSLVRGSGMLTWPPRSVGALEKEPHFHLTPTSGSASPDGSYLWLWSASSCEVSDRLPGRGTYESVGSWMG